MVLFESRTFQPLRYGTIPPVTFWLYFLYYEDIVSYFWSRHIHVGLMSILGWLIGYRVSDMKILWKRRIIETRFYFFADKNSIERPLCIPLTVQQFILPLSRGARAKCFASPTEKYRFFTKLGFQATMNPLGKYRWNLNIVQLDLCIYIEGNVY